MKPILTIVCYNQFGYLTDTFEYCKYFSKEYQIEYICIDSGQQKVAMESVNVIYFSTENKGILKWLQFMLFAQKSVRTDSKVLFIKYSLFCSVLSMKYRDIAIFDVRTGSVKKNKHRRNLENFLIRTESKFFKYKTVISQALAKLLLIKEYQLLPLGAHNKEVRNKLFNKHEKMSLLYIGTFSGRELHNILLGLSLFLNKEPDANNIVLNMVGDGYGNELEKLELLSNQLRLSDHVIFHGRVPYEQTGIFFEECNVGISYVPKTVYFDAQPVTKTYEYLTAGMPIIGTSTSEHLNLINSPALGELCDDNPESFAEALRIISLSFSQYDSELIKDKSKAWSWEHVCNNLNVFVNNIANNK
ncbi:MAG: glycosyltransferase [Gammaproteobacteria bacterium]|nr:glycosyltransferase [Gammaproteobacteria bacterium]